MSPSESKDRPIWQRIPLYLQIAIALIFAVWLGILLGAGQPNPDNIPLIKNLASPAVWCLKLYVPLPHR